MTSAPGTHVVQITNLSAAVSSDQMRTLFGFLGDIEELRLYPPDNAPLSFSSKVCYIKFQEPSSVGVAQHLTNTVFIDRALIVVPCAEGKIPEEAKALSLLAPVSPMASLMCGGGLLPVPTPPVLHKRALSVTSLGVLKSTLETSVSVLTAIASQPPLMGNVDPTKVDEIRRTVYVGNLNSQSTTAEQLLEFFTQVGDVKFVRMAGDETQPTRFAFVEFADQESVMRALNFNGVMFRDRPLKINHSNNAIVKPPELTPQAAAKELEDVMKKVRVAQSTIAAAIEPEEEEEETKKTPPSCSRRSRSRSRSSQRKQSRSKHRGGPSRRSWQRISNTHSSHRRRSTSRERRRSRSRSRSRDHRRNQDGQIRKNGDRNENRTRRGKDRMASSGHGGSRHSHGESRGRKYKNRNKGCVSGSEKREGSLSAWRRDSDGKAKSSQVKHAVDEYDGEMDDSVGRNVQPLQVYLNGS